MAREFAVVPPNLALAWLVPGLAIAGSLGVVLWAARGEPGVLVTIPMLAATAAVVALALRRRKVELEGGVLRVVAGFNRTQVPVAAIDLDAARVVDLDRQRELRPGIKWFATSVPGYQAGHFRRWKGHRTFALVTDRRRVLALPERSGRMLLLSLEHPQALLDALRTART